MNTLTPLLADIAWPPGVPTALKPLVGIIELLSTNPARIIGLKGRGSLARGSIADVTIFDPGARWTFHAEKSLSKSRNTPFDGWQLTGRVVATIVGGNFVYRLG